MCSVNKDTRREKKRAQKATKTETSCQNDLNRSGNLSQKKKRRTQRIISSFACLVWRNEEKATSFTWVAQKGNSPSAARSPDTARQCHDTPLEIRERHKEKPMSPLEHCYCSRSCATPEKTEREPTFMWCEMRTLSFVLAVHRTEA